MQAVGDEVEPPDDVDLGRLGDEVVQHVVEDPGVASGMLAPAEALGELLDRLLLTGGELRGAVDQPDGMVQVQDVDAGNRSVGVDELRVEAGDVAGLLGPELVDGPSVAGRKRIAFWPGLMLIGP